MKPKFKPGQIVKLKNEIDAHSMGKVVRKKADGMWYVKLISLDCVIWEFEHNMILQPGQCVEQLTKRPESRLKTRLESG